MRKKVLRKPLAILVALAMVVTTLGAFTTVSFASDNSVKFSVEISSKDSHGDIGSVKGEIYSDYSGKLTVKGDYVNASNATVTVTMTDVASLGVTGTRTYTRPFTFNANRDVSMSNVIELFNKLDETSIDFTYGGKAVQYNIEGEDGNYTLSPSSREEAAAVWHAMVNADNFEYGVKDEDSYVIIGNGSWLRVGNSSLEFEEDFDQDLKLDNFGDMPALNQNIRDAVTLRTLDETTEGISFYIAKGTELALGSSYARLKEPAAFDFEFEKYGDIEESLYKLRDMTGSTTDMMITLFGVLDTAFTAIGGEAIEAQGTIGELPVPDDVDFEKQELAKAVIEAVKTLAEGTYTSDSFSELMAAIEAANSVIDNEESDLDDIDIAYVNLISAWRMLEPVDQEMKAEEAAKNDAVDALAEALIKAIAVKTGQYKTSTVEPFKAAIETGKAVLADEDATLNALKTAKTDLLKAQVGLVKKDAQKIKVTTKAKKVKYAKLKKAKRTVKAITVKNAVGKVTYKKVSGSAKLIVNKKTGKITVKKKTKKGLYKAKVKVSAAATGDYKTASKVVTVKIRVK